MHFDTSVQYLSYFYLEIGVDFELMPICVTFFRSHKLYLLKNALLRQLVCCAAAATDWVLFSWYEKVFIKCKKKDKQLNVIREL